MGNSNSVMENPDEASSLREFLLSPGHLPVGVGFRPTDVELVRYLSRKNSDTLSRVDKFMITEAEVYKLDPSDLPDKAAAPSGRDVWHFFALKDRRYPGGRRQNRANKMGSWKITGEELRILESQESPVVIGKRRTLVFHRRGVRPGGDRTVWVIHEFTTNSDEDNYVLCRLTKKHEGTLTATRKRHSNIEGETSGSSPAATNSVSGGSPLPTLVVQPEVTATQFVSGTDNPTTSDGYKEEEPQYSYIFKDCDEGTSSFEEIFNEGDGSTNH